MTRWAPGAEARLHDAALELFLENGFAATTVPQIAERAGLTTRSFFRYFSDKREVLFSGEEELPAIVARMFADADADLSPLDVARQGFRTIVFPRLVEFRDELVVRRQIVKSDPGLQERELRKLAILHEAATTALMHRGLSRLDAEIAGRMAVTVYDVTVESWLADDARGSLDDLLETVLDAVGRTATSRDPRRKGS
ncbi:TetR/AcrR family transcriptional regulator [Herbiconiux sp. UC225_62]|uniref:TetR/AcrR family transcriptional regulator n=1 Tax=Herbiconiux sp. UC225_62 TaxID=3350168 RepID=UPI0036D37A29